MFRKLRLSACFLAFSLACHSPPESTVRFWELALAQARPPQPVARARVSFKIPLPSRLVKRLSDEFELVTVTTPAEWRELCRHLDEGVVPKPLNFAPGTIIGLLAKVGERAEPGWPTQIRRIRFRQDQAAVEAVFNPGLYHPLLTAAYLELVYVPVNCTVTLVRINQRQFILHDRR